LDLVSVALVDGLLHGGRDQDVTLFVQEVVLVTRVSFGLGEARDCAVIIAPVNINTFNFRKNLQGARVGVLFYFC
jgi:hypothetical protein